MHVRPVTCERDRQFASLDLDGELSLFERGILRRHLRRCASCAEYARMVTGFTELLRATPLEQIRLESIGWRSRRPVSRVVRSITAAAAVVAFATWFGVSYSAPRGCPITAPRLFSGPVRPSTIAAMARRVAAIPQALSARARRAADERPDALMSVGDPHGSPTGPPPLSSTVLSWRKLTSICTRRPPRTPERSIMPPRRRGRAETS